MHVSNLPSKLTAPCQNARKLAFSCYLAAYFVSDIYKEIRVITNACFDLPTIHGRGKVFDSLSVQISIIQTLINEFS